MVRECVALAIAVALCSTRLPRVDSLARDRQSEYDTLLAELTSGDVNARAKAWARLPRQRDLSISVLQRIAETKEDSRLATHLEAIVTSDVRRQAIVALGAYRAESAAAWLGQHFAMRLVPSGVSEEGNPFENYPAAEAIVNIGERGIQALLYGASQHELDSEHRKLVAYVLWFYYSPQDEQDVGLYRLQRLLERAEKQRRESEARYGPLDRPSMREENLRALIEMYPKINPNKPDDWPKP